MPKIEPRRTRRKTKVKNKNPENHEEHEETQVNKEVRRQDTHFGSLISDWGLKNRQNIEAEKQDPKSAFQNTKCIGSSTPFKNACLGL